MIPNRIYLKGFLSYRDPVEFDFHDESLWTLTGPNGAGKSAVFDAMTYALFGVHRLGSQNAEELIHKESEMFEVEFDFEHGGNEYRVRRALRRSRIARTVQQAYRRLPGDPGVMAPGFTGNWQVISETEGVKEIKLWVEKTLGLKYDTFTTSVLLLQGKADNLITADPKDRRAVLHGIVDMQRYLKLQERIEERRKEHKADREAQTRLLAGQPEVALANLESARVACTDLERRQQKIKDAFDAWQRIEVQAERWPILSTQIAELDSQLTEAEKILAQADAISQDWRRWQELRERLPRLEDLQAAEHALAIKQRELQTLSDHQQQLLVQQTVEEKERGDLQAQLEANQQTLAKIQSESQRLDLTIAQLESTLARCGKLADRHRELASLGEQIARLPADLPTQVKEASAIVSALTELNTAWPLLASMAEDRATVLHEVDRLTQLANEQKVVEAEWKSAKESQQLADEAHRAAECRRQQLQEERAVAQIRFDEVTKRAQRFQSLQGQPTCSACGQALTADHLHAEQERLESERTQTLGLLNQAKQALAESERLTESTYTEAEKQRRRFETSARRVQDSTRAKQTAEQERSRAEQAWARAAEHVPESYRRRHRPESLDFPSDAERADWQQRLRQLPERRSSIEPMRSQLESLQALTQKRDLLQAALAADSLPASAELAKLQQEYQELQAERLRLQAQRERLEAEQQTLEPRREKLDLQSRELGSRHGQLLGTLQTVRKQTVEIEQTIVRARQAVLPSPALDLQKEIESARVEFAKLEASAARHQTMLLAQERVGDWRKQAARLKAEATMIPDTARQPVAAIREQKRQAEASLREVEKEYRLAERQLAKLHEQFERRAQISKEIQHFDRHYHLCDRLASLLGPKGLQLHLMREAEQGIVRLANEVLERLSGSELMLELAQTKDGDPTENPLQLQVRTRTFGQHPLQVAQLSGSQKFRVSVSLALAIGQYASREPQALESVIIDEGFGCLDREGRQIMIQELQLLKDQLKRIILVSHQEEFAETFSAGYLLRIEAGTTKVQRLHS